MGLMDSTQVVAQILDQSGLTKVALSRKSGVSRSLLDSYLKGQSQPSLAQVQRLAEAAGCAVDLTVRKRPAKTLPDQFIAVLEFGELFPRKAPKPLVNLGPIWRGAQTTS